MPRWIRVNLVIALAAGWVAVAAAPAHADCVSPPVKSEHAFTGTVTSTGRDGRIAHVTTDDGRKVTVRGAESDTAVTTVDRVYQTGARYEFHPLNHSDPYRDNACTATRKLADGAPMRPAGAESADLPASWGTLAAAAALTLALGLATGGLVLARRRQRRL